MPVPVPVPVPDFPGREGAPLSRKGGGGPGEGKGVRVPNLYPGSSQGKKTSGGTWPRSSSVQKPTISASSSRR